MQPQEEPNPLMRKKKTPEELAAEAEQEELDDFTSKYQIFYISALFVFIFAEHNKSQNKLLSFY